MYVAFKSLKLQKVQWNPYLRDHSVPKIERIPFELGENASNASNQSVQCTYFIP